jgi:hypothetical protein
MCAMALLTQAQEYAAIREAIQTLTATGQSVVSLNVDGVSVSYAASQLTNLQAREIELANRICNRNRRKRTSPDFSYDA